MLMSSQQNPVQISKNGKPVAVVVSMSDYQHLEELKLKMLQERVTKARQDIDQGKITDGDALFDELIPEE